MPWHVEQGAAGCAGWAVIKDADGSLAGCHPSQAEAMAQVAALYAQEPTMAPMAPGQGCPPGQHKMPDGTCMDNMDMVAALTGGSPVHGVIAVEGEYDGSSPKRMFAPGSLEWAPTPFALKWQPAEDEGHDGAVIVGRIDEVWRDGPLINFRGIMDDAGDYGAEAVRLMGLHMLRGASIMADDMEEQDVEYVYPMPPVPPPDMAPPPADEMLPLEPPPDVPLPEAPTMHMDMPGMEMEPVAEIYHHGRIRSVTLLPEPAFVEATVELGEPVVTAAAVAPHGGATSDGPWDGPANEKQLPSPMPVGTARKAYAWIDDSQIADGQITKVASKFLHHDVSGGSPGAANVKACQTGIGVLNGGRGGTTIPAGDVQGVYNHLARHLRDAELEAPPLTASMTAAAYTITIPEIWPEAWFEEPTEAPPIGALHITPQGRVFGYLGPDRVAHRAFRASGRTVTIPRGVDYGEFQNKPCLVAGADGQVYRINAGNITFDCGHPSPYDDRRSDPAWAMQHYDNTCSIAARIRVGENRHGTWVAGALLHGITPDAVERMMACALSGDWQGGRLNAALLVPVEGFPVAQTSSVRIRDDAMVASTVPVRYVPDGPAPNYRPVLERIARSAGRDPASRFAALRARVKTGR